MIKVLAVDDHPVVRKGLKQIFDQTDDIKVISEAWDSTSALKKVSENNQIDLILLDIEMPDTNGLTTLRRLREIAPTSKVLIFSMHSEEVYAINCVKAGAMGFLHKSSSSEQIIEAVRRVMSGGIYLSESLAQRLTEQGSNRHVHRSYKRLSSREIEVLKLICSGKKNKDIAEELDINEKTVSTYKARLFNKLGVSNVIELINCTQSMEIFR